ncbi:MAG: hypothetical protein ACKESB_03080 [Candidatus Hodgkinia cicadicola]
MRPQNSGYTNTKTKASKNCSSALTKHQLNSNHAPRIQPSPTEDAVWRQLYLLGRNSWLLWQLRSADEADRRSWRRGGSK